MYVVLCCVLGRCTRMLCEELLEEAGPGMGGRLDQARDTFPKGRVRGRSGRRSGRRAEREAGGAAGGRRSSARRLRRKPALSSRIRAARGQKSPPKQKLTCFLVPIVYKFLHLFTVHKFK